MSSKNDEGDLTLVMRKADVLAYNTALAHSVPNFSLNGFVTTTRSKSAFNDGKPLKWEFECRCVTIPRSTSTINGVERNAIDITLVKERMEEVDGVDEVDKMQDSTGEAGSKSGSVHLGRLHGGFMEHWFVQNGREGKLIRELERAMREAGMWEDEESESEDEGEGSEDDETSLVKSNLERKKVKWSVVKKRCLWGRVKGFVCSGRKKQKDRAKVYVEMSESRSLLAVADDEYQVNEEEAREEEAREEESVRQEKERNPFDDEGIDLGRGDPQLIPTDVDDPFHDRYCISSE